MPKEWVLNQATNRWGLNKKNSVGPTSYWIRETNPSTLEEWESAYLRKLGAMLADQSIELSPEAYLQGLGEKLYVKITEVVQAEIEAVTERDCVGYIRQLVLDRTFDGYQNEIRTVYGQLARALGVEIQPAPDEWDRLYNVDFYIDADGIPVGIQIKPLTYEQMADAHRWRAWLAASHDKFEHDHGGRVFVVFSTKAGAGKKIANDEVVSEIEAELRRLGASEPQM